MSFPSPPPAAQLAVELADGNRRVKLHLQRTSRDRDKVEEDAPLSSSMRSSS
jgi:hypothetical protein